MVKALADRLAEAFAELLHERARREWGYESDESLQPRRADCGRKYRGIRPAFGYPACPDHTEKEDPSGSCLALNEIGISLTEHFAMNPGASVSGIYLGSSTVPLFCGGPESIATRWKTTLAESSMSVAEAERWLQPNLGYQRGD